MKRNEINEELAKEIRKSWCKDCEDAIVDADTLELLDGCEMDSESYCAEKVRQNIRRILSAVRDGKQKIPGEAGRAVWMKQGDEDHIYDWVAEVIENGARTFIALRQEKGGKR